MTDPIMQRMKENYESRSRSYLLRRTPVIIRLDGKAFHTYTKHLNKPFDSGLTNDMIEVTKFLCKNIQGVRLGYYQSDEISLLLTDYTKLESQAWFDYELQKVCSVAASLATSKFNQLRIARHFHKMDSDFHTLQETVDSLENFTMGNFDARAFNLPKEEVANYFLARQKDAVKNSISMLAQSLYSPKELHGKNSNEKQEMCFQKGRNWNNEYYVHKRGGVVVQFTQSIINDENETLRKVWKLDEDAPIVFNEDYFNKYL